MRYAIVIEKAENNFSGYVPDLQVVLPRVPQWKKRSRFFAKRLNFIWPDFAKTALNPLSHPAASITSKLPHND